MTACPDRGRLPGLRSGPFFRRPERTSCRSPLFLPVFTRPRAPRHATRSLLAPVETFSPPDRFLSLEYTRGGRAAATVHRGSSLLPRRASEAFTSPGDPP